VTAASKPGDPADKASDGAFGGQPTGSHRAGYGETLARVEAWLRAHPRATLASGEGWALVEEIDRLRAAIDRVRALHCTGLKGASCVECGYNYPCLTLRALGEEGA
jgi:hypothetical protein